MLTLNIMGSLLTRTHYLRLLLLFLTVRGRCKMIRSLKKKCGYPVPIRANYVFDLCFLITFVPNIPSEMSFDIPVWCCSQIFFLFCFAPQWVALFQIQSSQFRKKLLLLLFGCLLSVQRQKSRNYFYLFFCWQAFFLYAANHLLMPGSAVYSSQR